METQASKQDYAIWAQGLTRKFGNELAVDDVHLEIPRGTVFGFIGPSGAGKTTTIRLLTGIYEPTDGELLVLGRPPSLFSSKMRQRIGYMPQLFVLYPDLSLWENLNFAASLYGMGLRRGKRLKEVLEFVELLEHSRKLARNVSGGMQRRLSLAATLVHNPDLIFLDEPTAGIDPVLRRKFWDRFAEIKQEGRTLFITTQYVGESAYCDLVGVLAEGRLVHVNTPLGLRKDAFGGDIVSLTTESPLESRQIGAIRRLPFVKRRIVVIEENHLHITVGEAGTDMQELIDWCNNNDVVIKTIEEYQPPFDDVFVELVKKEKPAGV